MQGRDFEAERRAMVERQLQANGIRDERVLAAMARVPRHRFVPEGQLARAYGDYPVPIGRGQTMSQPYMVARMTELAGIGGRERVLEIGAGSGYQTAILCELAAEVYSVEILPELCVGARARLAALGYARVRLECFDGSHGWPEHAPYDVILVAAGAPVAPPLLLHQLADGGRLVIPVGARGEQRLMRYLRQGETFAAETHTPCRFVDLVGRYGWGGEGPARA